MAAPNIADHKSLSQDNLSDGPAQNMQYWMGQVPTAGQLSGGSRAKGLVAATAAINTTETVLAQIPLLAGTSLAVGSIIKGTLYGTCTNTAADLSTFAIRAGILGTIGDQSVTTATVTAGTNGTAVPFSVDFEFVVRTLGATGTAELGTKILNGTSAATGLTGVAPYGITNVITAGTNLATTTATFLSLTYLSAAITTTSTFQIANLILIP